MDAASLARNPSPRTSRRGRRATAHRPDVQALLREGVTARELQRRTGISQSVAYRLAPAAVRLAAAQAAGTAPVQLELRLVYARLDEASAERDALAAQVARLTADLRAADFDREMAEDRARASEKKLVEVMAFRDAMAVELDQAKHRLGIAEMAKARASKLARRNRSGDEHHIRALCRTLCYVGWNAGEAMTVTMQGTLAGEAGEVTLTREQRRLFSALRAEIESVVDEHYLRAWKSSGMTAIAKQAARDAGIRGVDELNAAVELARAEWIADEIAACPWPWSADEAPAAESDDNL